MSASCHFEKLKVPIAVFISVLGTTLFRCLRSISRGAALSGNSPKHNPIKNCVGYWNYFRRPARDTQGQASLGRKSRKALDNDAPACVLATLMPTIISCLITQGDPPGAVAVVGVVMALPRWACWSSSSLWSCLYSSSILMVRVFVLAVRGVGHTRKSLLKVIHFYIKKIFVMPGSLICMASCFVLSRLFMSESVRPLSWRFAAKK